MKRSLRHFLVFIAWNIAITGAIFLAIRDGAPLPRVMVGAVAVLGMALLLIHRYLLQSGTPGAAERARLLRLNPLQGETLRWTLIATPVLLLFSWSAGEVYIGLVPVPMEELDPFRFLFVTPQSRLLLALLAIGIAPLLEEMFFRGLIQHELEVRWGAVAGIVASASLFALAHFLPWVFPLHLLLGCVFGFVVYATHSLWAGVLLHAANNVAALLAAALQGEEMSPAPTVWETGLTLDWASALGLLLFSAIAASWVGTRLLRAGLAERLRPQPNPG